MELDEVVKLLEEIAPKVGNWHEIGTNLREKGLETAEDPLWKYVFAFEYMFVENDNKEYFDLYGPFAPWITTTEGVFPPPLLSINNETLEEWSIVLSKVKHPIISSRLADLLWERKWGERPDRFAQQAIDAYVDVSKNNWEGIYHANCLTRALDLCNQVRDKERKLRIISSIIAACDQEEKSGGWKPGVSLRLIEALMKLPKNDIPNDVDTLLENALNIYGNDAWIVENVIGLMIKRADRERQRELQVYQVKKWIEEAEKGRKGLVQASHLEHALELARNYGLHELVEELRLRIQSIPETDFGYETISTTVNVPFDKVEAFLNWFVDKKGWKESFIRFGYYGPPSGEYKKNIEEIDVQSKESPLRFLVTNSIYDEFNSPIQIGRNLDENKEIALVNQETMGIRFFAKFAPDILQRINQKYGSPSIAEYTEFFETSLITQGISENIAKAIDWFYKGEYDVAAHILVPRIESIIRILARDLGLPIIREPVGTTPGGVVQLGTLLTMLQGRMDESWRRYLYNVLSNPIGVNLRNRICHGILPIVEKEDAALLLHVVCYLRLMEISTSVRPIEPE